MKPISISEKMMYNTVRLATVDGSSGTGSFFDFKIGNKKIPIIITNKHVINYNEDETVTFYLHTMNRSGNPDGNVVVTYNAKWNFHENKDLCYCYISSLFNEVEKVYGKKVYYTANEERLVPSKQRLYELNALEELVMVGYPIGLWDERNNFPIFRRGYTACHPAIDFNDDGIGLVDIACFPGSSGSPIYIFNENGYRDKRGNINIGNSRLLLLGYLFAGPVHSASGDLIIQTIPTQQIISTNTPTMVNLGYYIKSFELQSFHAQIQSDLRDIIYEPV